ncbi:alpha-L-rhamnosidase C-terminal domain-containing protein [Streptomyces sp. R21]|uniref:Alpha-L-rhamnosidase C-terminal domain-containing protein n=1 Tax=Streptomyces sp. R21 TaxID=3238627 RepID=A0AB39P4N9_9ACTN
MRPGSQNHHFLGQVDAWLINGPAGINQAPGSTGYRHLEIAPAVVGDLPHASGSYRTPQGPVTSAWEKGNRGRLTLKISIPVGSTAVVRVPQAPAPASPRTAPLRRCLRTGPPPRRTTVSPRAVTPSPWAEPPPVCAAGARMPRWRR